MTTVMETANTMPTETTFNPNDHVIQIKNKGGSSDYLPVQWRLVWFREQCPNGTIETEEMEVDLDRETTKDEYVWNNETRRSEKVTRTGRGYARFRATVMDGKGGIATGTKVETAANFPDYTEKAETGAVGRALAMLGYGTQFASPELAEGERIVDAPVDRTQASTDRPATSQGDARSATHSTDHTEPKSNNYKEPTPRQLNSLIDVGVEESAAKSLNAWGRMGENEVSKVLTTLWAKKKETDEEDFNRNKARYAREVVTQINPRLYRNLKPILTHEEDTDDVDED